MATNFHLAPPPKTVDGLLAVPIDISSLDATLMFDGATSTAAADATITYTVGPTSGNPIFDLRQTITQAWLDGAPFAPAALAHHTFGSESFTDLRVIESLQAASSVHTLRVRYNLALPDSEMGGAYLPAIDWLAGPKLRFVFGLSDLNRARYAEAWLPANLIFDQFSISLEIEILNTMAAHAVITNAAVTALGTNHWRVEFPARFSAVSPLLEVRAADTLQQQTGTVALPVSGKTVTIEAWKPAGSPIDLGAQIDSSGTCSRRTRTTTAPTCPTSGSWRSSTAAGWNMRRDHNVRFDPRAADGGGDPGGAAPGAEPRLPATRRLTGAVESFPDGRLRCGDR
jgi:hypothetical protein